MNSNFGNVEKKKHGDLGLAVSKSNIQTMCQVLIVFSGCRANYSVYEPRDFIRNFLDFCIMAKQSESRRQINRCLKTRLKMVLLRSSIHMVQPEREAFSSEVCFGWERADKESLGLCFCKRKNTSNIFNILTS